MTVQRNCPIEYHSGLRILAVFLISIRTRHTSTFGNLITLVRSWYMKVDIQMQGVPSLFWSYFGDFYP